jgi:hypothetical protein
MMTNYQDACQVRDRQIILQLQMTEEGIQGLLAGGEHSHIGAVTLVSPEGSVETKAFPGHKEAELAENFARSLYHAYHVPVVMSCGIHYDNITRDEISQVLAACNQMLQRFLHL